MVLTHHSPIVCEVKKLNLIEVYNKIADDVAMLIDIKIKNINRDITFKATVIEKVSDTKYKILYKKQYHTAWCLAKLVIGSTVHVCAPGNDWSELFINQSCTRKEFEELKSELSNKVDMSSSLVSGTDFNKVINSGFYRFNLRDNYLNAPPNSWGQLLVIHGNGDTIAQISFDYTTSASFYVRSGNPPECGGSGSWKPWYKYTGVVV